MKSMRQMAIGGIGTGLLFLGGCMVGPDYQPTKTEMPAKWDGLTAAVPGQTSAVTTEAAELSEWWNILKDPELSRLITKALDANLDLRTAESALRQARATRDVTAAGFWPSVNGAGSYARSGPVGGGRSSDLFQAGLDAAWELDFFGGTRRSIEAADANADASRENLRAVRISVAAEVAADYVQLRAFQQRIQIAHENLLAQKHSAELTRRKLAGGLASALDVANADALVASTESSIAPLETSERQTIYALSVLLARMPSALREELSAPGPIPQAPAQVPAGLPSALLQRRPDIRQSEALVHAATAEIGVAKAQWFPQFSLTGTLGFQSDTLRGLLRSDSGTWSVGPSVTWPIFTAGRIQANIQVQNEAQTQALLTYEKTVLTALQDVENSLVAFALEQQHRQSLEQTVAANKKAVDLATQLYTQGQSEFLNVLDAQRSLLSAQDSLVLSNAAIATDLIALYKALGGGWSVR